MRSLRCALAAAASLAAAALLSGCASAPAERFYTLSAGALPQNAPAAPRYTVGVGPVTVPESVDRPQLVLRTSDNRMALLDGHRWIAPLKTEIPRVLAESIARALGDARVAAYPENAALDAAVRVVVDVRRFEAEVGGEALVEALWSVRRADGSARRDGHSAFREPAGAGYEGITAAYARALEAIGRDIAAAVRAL